MRAYRERQVASKPSVRGHKPKERRACHNSTLRNLLAWA
jgi:hypothetical protein